MNWKLFSFGNANINRKKTTKKLIAIKKIVNKLYFLFLLMMFGVFIWKTNKITKDFPCFSSVLSFFFCYLVLFLVLHNTWIIIRGGAYTTHNTLLEIANYYFVDVFNLFVCTYWCVHVFERENVRFFN
jgi:hypothetical protein